MGLMLSELYDALTSAGADDAKSRDAAIAVGELARKMAVLQWMGGFNLAISVAILFKVFS